MKNRIKTHSIAVFAAALALSATLAYATPPTIITWGTPTGITGDSDVINSGTLLGAFNLGSTGVTGTSVNGILFSPLVVPADGGGTAVTSGNFSITYNGSGRQSSNALGSASTPFSSLSAAYQTLLGSGVTSYNSQQNFNIVMSGLTTGQAYQFEWWSSESNTTFLPYDTNTATGPSGTTVTLNDNPSATAGGAGQYDVGTFTATSSTVTVNYTANSAPELVNAFVLSTVAVPEPSTWAMMAAGAGSLLLFKRRRL